ncbi:hypothetical protein B0H17DRAFT_1148468 [Mycena rosella]|uniref:Uncharacterized protein n=1 Tax=Mycena rosella TaxID=1033263 RepID=A0AAD7CCU0_MYCRO|nr:hypothetical protein B0H17DRAFT_1148468 [Mycena rosella]
MFAKFPRTLSDSPPATPACGPRRRVCCKICRQELTTHEHMLDHGHLGMPTPAAGTLRSRATLRSAWPRGRASAPRPPARTPPALGPRRLCPRSTRMRPRTTTPPRPARLRPLFSSITDLTMSALDVGGASASTFETEDARDEDNSGEDADAEPQLQSHTHALAALGRRLSDAVITSRPPRPPLRTPEARGVPRAGHLHVTVLPARLAPHPRQPQVLRVLRLADEVDGDVPRGGVDRGQDRVPEQEGFCINRSKVDEVLRTAHFSIHTTYTYIRNLLPMWRARARVKRKSQESIDACRGFFIPAPWASQPGVLDTVTGPSAQHTQDAAFRLRGVRGGPVGMLEVAVLLFAAGGGAGIPVPVLVAVEAARGVCTGAAMGVGGFVKLVGRLEGNVPKELLPGSTGLYPATVQNGQHQVLLMYAEMPSVDPAELAAINRSLTRCSWFVATTSPRSNFQPQPIGVSILTMPVFSQAQIPPIRTVEAECGAPVLKGMQNSRCAAEHWGYRSFLQ